MSSTPLHVHDHGGEGPALLLLHGAGRSHADWDAVVPFLLPHHRVLAADLPGHGGSAAPPAGGWSFESAATAIETALRDHGAPDAALVGHSLGGMTAAFCAATRPGTPAAVNLDGFWWGTPGRYEADARVRETVRAAAGAVMPAEYIAQQAAYAGKFGIPYGRAERAARAAARELPDGRWQTLPERDISLAMYDEMDALDLFALFRKVECPLLLVRAGREQPPGPPGMEWFDAFLSEYGAGLTDDLAALRAYRPETVTVERIDATHALLLEEPEAVAALVRGFVTRPGPQGS
ncbi:alpha/beta hydrolase [Streptomyces sp. NPDC048442]|uniref:alpha/beta fold hydrolase n=1 Tax=Streptomyces sp. NPDC048442 TaxID=3154823 RepID=UPI00343B6E74